MNHKLSITVSGSNCTMVYYTDRNSMIKENGKIEDCLLKKKRQPTKPQKPNGHFKKNTYIYNPKKTVYLPYVKKEPKKNMPQYLRHLKCKKCQNVFHSTLHMKVHNHVYHTLPHNLPKSAYHCMYHYSKKLSNFSNINEALKHVVKYHAYQCYKSKCMKHFKTYAELAKHHRNDHEH